MLNNKNTSDPIRFEINRQIGYVILDNPPENRMTVRFFISLQNLILNVKKMDQLRGLIICSSGRHFSSGADLNELTDTILLHEKMSRSEGIAKEMNSIIEENVKTFFSIALLNIPVVAVVNGLCIGSALELSLCADIRVCEQRSTLGLPEVQFDIMPGCGATVRLPGLIGIEAALKLILTGELFTGEEAYTYGVVDTIVPKKQGIVMAEQLINAVMNEKLTKKEFRQRIKSYISSLNN